MHAHSHTAKYWIRHETTFEHMSVIQKEREKKWIKKAQGSRFWNKSWRMSQVKKLHGEKALMEMHRICTQNLALVYND